MTLTLLPNLDFAGSDAGAPAFRSNLMMMGLGRVWWLPFLFLLGSCGN